jgi:hypothetical protein
MVDAAFSLRKPSCGTVAPHDRQSRKPVPRLLTHQGKYHGRIAGAAIGARAAGKPLDAAPWGTHATTADHYAAP